MIMLIIRQIKELYSIYMVLLVIAIGLFTIFIDAKSLKEDKLDKDYKIARALGLVFIVGGPGMYIILRFINI